MSQASSPENFPPPLVAVADTSFLIEFKKLVNIDHQWELLTKMGELVKQGALAFPRQVAKELAYGKHPDAPGAWIGSAKKDVCHPQPTEDTLKKVLEVAPQLVDYEGTDESEVADPYVVAMALEIAAKHSSCRVVVATKDVVDRLPLKLSLQTACGLLGVEVWSPEHLIAWLRDGSLPDAGP